MHGTPLSLALFWVAVVAYLVGFVAFVLHIGFRRRALSDIGVVAAMTGWPFHLGSIVARALEAGHWPLGNMYEYSTGISFVMVTAFLVLALRHRIRLVGAPAMGLAVALLGLAYMLYVPPGSLVPALHSYWLTIHVTAMATSSGILTFSFVFGMAYLLRRWADRSLAAAAAARVAMTPGGTPVSVGGGRSGGDSGSARRGLWRAPCRARRPSTSGATGS